MANIAIIDADLIGRKKHRFPNLACMKLSGWHKNHGDSVCLKTDYDNLDDFDTVYISKVFTDTEINQDVLNKDNVQYGGTGFYYDKSPDLPYEIEHFMPDYSLYDEYVAAHQDERQTDFKFYKEYSIGFLTRGCFRHCEFCVNKNYNAVEKHSPLSEFLDTSRKKICLLDDNFLGCKDWKILLTELQSANKRYQFRQGLDIRLLTDDKCEMLFKGKYDKEYFFAFDNIADAKLIENKLRIMRKYYDKRVMFYTLCAFDRNNVYDNNFWKRDIVGLFERIKILMNYNSLPYIMRFNKYIESPYAQVYTNIANWCNMRHLFTKISFREFVEKSQQRVKSECSATKSLKLIENDIPEAAVYLDLCFDDLYNNYRSDIGDLENFKSA